MAGWNLNHLKQESKSHTLLHDCPKLQCIPYTDTAYLYPIFTHCSLLSSLHFKWWKVWHSTGLPLTTEAENSTVLLTWRPPRTVSCNVTCICLYLYLNLASLTHTHSLSTCTWPMQHTAYDQSFRGAYKKRISVCCGWGECYCRRPQLYLDMQQPIDRYKRK